MEIDPALWDVVEGDTEDTFRLIREMLRHTADLPRQVQIKIGNEIRSVSI